MRNIALIISVLALATVVLAAEKRPVAVEGVVLQLNQPGTIVLEISIGSDDGLNVGDIFVASRKGKRIGKLKVAKCEPDKSTAKIIDVQDGEALQTGDQIARKQ